MKKENKLDKKDIKICSLCWIEVMLKINNEYTFYVLEQERIEKEKLKNDLTNTT